MPGQAHGTAPAPTAPADQGGVYAKMAVATGLGLGYVAVSACLINYNKYLIHPDRFPSAISLVLIHACFCSVFAFFLYLVRPSLFPSLSDPERKVTIDADLIFKGALPIALLFSAQLVLSNTAYLHSSVAFLQMMKEGNLVLVYLFSLIACMEKFSYRSVCILAFITFATSLTIHGEMNFSWTGFVIQGSGQLFECGKIVLQAMLLTSAGRKLDALTYVMIVMPLCAVFLALGICALMVFPHENFLVPSMAQIMVWKWHLLANACVAFCLNVVIALFIKHSSAVAFVLAGIVKDAMIVTTSVFFMREVVSVLQFVGFGLQLFGILVWSLIKSFPNRFEAGVITGFRSFVVGEDMIKGKVEGQYGSTEGSKA